MSDYLKIPPHSPEAEQSLLGGLLLGGDYDEVSFLASDDFYSKSNRTIFAAIEELVDKSRQHDAVTVGEYLEAKNLAEEAGGVGYLISLVNNTTGYSNIREYAEIVHKRACLRKLIKTATETIDRCFNTEGRTADEVIEQAEQEIFKLVHTEKDTGIIHAREIIARTLDGLDERQRAGGGLVGISTGYEDLDQATLGLEKQSLTIIAGRPSMGKSALAFGMLFNSALKNNQSVLGFTMEMSTEQLMQREISGMTSIPFEKIRKGNLNQEEWGKVTAASGRISEARISFDGTPALTPTQIRSRARKHAARNGLDLVVIDYLQLMRCKAERNDLMIGEITGQMKAMAKELNVPVILLSQLNRKLEDRGNKRPIMADLRDSGAIEQDADVILGVYRDEVYNEDTTEKGIAEIIILKQRNGAIGTVRLAFRGHLTKFDNYIHEWMVA